MKRFASFIRMPYICSQILILMMRPYVLFILASLPLCLKAQEVTDTVSVSSSPTLTEQNMRMLTTPLSELPVPDASNGLDAGLHPLDATDLGLDSALAPSSSESQRVPQIRYELFPRGSYLPHWSTGYMYGSHQYSGSLLYGYHASAMAGIKQQLGQYWSVNAYASFNKYSIHYNNATIGGSITWQPSPYFALTAFGAYQTSSFGTQWQIGPAFDYGGYITLQTDTDVPFGIDLGAYNAYDAFSGHQVTPIVNPFVKIGGAKLGIDIGPLIRDALRNASGKGHEGGPGLIPKPIKAMPSIAPRD